MYNNPLEHLNLSSTSVFQTCENCNGSGSLEIYNVYDSNYKKIEICECCKGTGFVSVEIEDNLN